MVKQDWGGGRFRGLCSHCGKAFTSKFTTAKLCFTCWQKRERALKEYDGLVDEVWRLRYAITRRQEDKGGLPAGMLKRLKQLCHPDRHHGTPREKAANEVMQWLNNLK